MKVVFMGTPEFSVPVLDALVDAGHRILAVYCQPPRPAGRGKRERFSPVQARARELDMEVRHPDSLKSDRQQAAFAALEADVAIVAAYGLLLPRAILNAPRHGCLNVHASLLPRWRGAAPIQRAIMTGDRTTGICIMRMTLGLDAGPVLLREKTHIGPEETAAELHDRLSLIGAGLVEKTLRSLHRLVAAPQSRDGVVYAAKIDKAETQVDWTEPAEVIDRQIRGLSPFPGAWTLLRGRRLKLLRSRVIEGGGQPGRVLGGLRIACGRGAVEVTEVQAAGKGRQRTESFLRGTPVPIGTVLESCRT